MFIPLGIAAWPVLVDLARRQYVSEKERRETRSFGRMKPAAVFVDCAAADVGGSADLGDEHTFRAKPPHDDYDFRT